MADNIEHQDKIRIMDAFVATRRFMVTNAEVFQRLSTMDNYVDETVLTLLDKRDNNVSAIIYTQQISRQFQLDIDRHNAQYAPIDVVKHSVYHMTASFV